MMGFRVVLFFLLIAFSIQTFAGEPGYEPYYEPRQPAAAPPEPSPPPPPPPPPAQPFTLYHATEPPRYVPPPTPPPAREEAPMETAPANFFTVSGDFLFWTAPEDGLTYVLNCATGPTTVSNCGSQEVEATWDPG